MKQVKQMKPCSHVNAVLARYREQDISNFFRCSEWEIGKRSTIPIIPYIVGMEWWNELPYF